MEMEGKNKKTGWIDGHENYCVKVKKSRHREVKDTEDFKREVKEY